MRPWKTKTVTACKVVGHCCSPIVRYVSTGYGKKRETAMGRFLDSRNYTVGNLEDVLHGGKLPAKGTISWA